MPGGVERGREVWKGAERRGKGPRGVERGREVWKGVALWVLRLFRHQMEI